MHRIIRCAVALTFVLSFAADAAGLFRAYVKSTGNDNSGCTLASPCRLLPAALNAIADGGEIWMLDSANYNTSTVTISKSVKILAVPGVVGSVVSTGVAAIVIQTANLQVALRNVVIVPLPGETPWGISIEAPSLLSIEDCDISNVSVGVYVRGGANMRMSNCTLRYNDIGVLIQDGTGVVSGSRIIGHGGSDGVSAAASAPNSFSAVTVNDSLITGGHGGLGASASGNNSVAKAVLTRTTIEGANYGVYATRFAGAVGSAASTTINGSSLVRNNYAWSADSGAIIFTTGDNHVSDNATSLGVLTPALTK